MNGTVNISEFIDHLEKHDLVIDPKSLVKQAELANLQNKLQRKKLLTFNEISQAKLLGDITPRAVKSFVMKYAKKDSEYVLLSNGRRPVYKVPMSTIDRLQTLRNFKS